MALPLLDGSEIFLRPYERDDFEDFAALMTDPEVTVHTDGPLPAGIIARLLGQFVACAPGGETEAWAVVHKVRQEYLGHAVLRAGTRSGERELLIILGRAHWRKGYGRTVGKLLIEYAAQSGANEKITASLDPDHTAAIGLLASLAFELDREETDSKGTYPVYRRSLRPGAQDGN
ncbi:GNAT family N-acetyltransferase [candidate division GN15 bacterium]|nr:GNAT family N-acetyltransferase [candidate division GN15 bacterium]